MSLTEVDFTLDVPADPGQIRTIRLFVSSIARQYECEPTSIEDLKLAISESCNLALDSLDEGSGDRITVKVSVDERVLTFHLGGMRNSDNGFRRVDAVTAESLLDTAAMGRELITALFPQARVDENEHGPTVELLLPI